MLIVLSANSCSGLQMSNLRAVRHIFRCAAELIVGICAYFVDGDEIVLVGRTNLYIIFFKTACDKELGDFAVMTQPIFC